MNANTKRFAIALATFTPGQITRKDYLAAHQLEQTIFGALCLAGLDMPRALYVGHTSTGTFLGGPLQHCVMCFDVSEIDRALAVIRQTLADAQMNPAHYEIAIVEDWLNGRFKTVYTPPGRASLLDGMARSELLAAARARNEELKNRNTSGLYDLAEQFMELHRSIESTLRMYPTISDNALKFSGFTKLQQTMRGNLADFPITIAAELGGLHAWKAELESFIAIPAEEIALHEPALKQLLAALEILVASITPKE